jgi:hypothetical protein
LRPDFAGDAADFDFGLAPFIPYIPLIRLKKPDLAPPPKSNRARLSYAADNEL